MNASRERMPRSGRAAIDDGGRTDGGALGTTRGRTLALLIGVLVLMVALYHRTFATMVETWLASDTFLHGFVIAPISGYLVWKRWPALSAIEVKPYYPGLAAVLVVSVFWWLNDLLGIQVGKQLAAVALVPLTVLVSTGRAFTRAIAFPLGYLVFAVPFGEGIVPYLIDFTATFTVEALQLTGFPVLREGAFFSIPAGNFEVAKACSGVRYLLASLALGTLYGYLVFDSLRKRLAFLLFALVLPIVANALRAFGIVLLAHYSSMRIAVGVDHVIFGWIFFGLVMLLMFWVGDRYRDNTAGRSGDDVAPAAGVAGSIAWRSGLVAVTVAVVVASTGPLLAATVVPQPAEAGRAGLPASSGAWQLVADAHGNWRPSFVGASFEVLGSYDDGGQRVDVAVIRYDTQRQGAEIANVLNSVAGESGWRTGRTSTAEIDVAAAALTVRETLLHRQERSRLVWSWIEVNGRPVSGDLETKWREGLSLLSLDVPVAAAVVVSAPVQADRENTRATLRAFVETSWADIHDCLYAVPGIETRCSTDERGTTARER